MPLTPRAPPYEIGGTQQRYQADHHHDRPPRSRTFRKETQPPAARGERSRSRSRSRDRRSSSSSRSINLLGLAVVIVLSVAFLSSFRHRREGIDGADGGDIAAAGEARLRREVQGLEDTLRRKKKALLGGGGVAAGLPPEGLSAGVGDGGGGGGGGGSTLRGGGRDWPSKQHATRVELEGRSRGSGDGYRTRPLPAPESPPIPPASLAGDPLYGPGSTPPLRQSLESQPGLIREPVPLIVGGTDGSGTRGVVALLQRLKVPMVVEDKGTMDVHGAPYMVKGGWPEVVRPVIAWAGGTGYESRAAPAGLRGKTFEALGNLRVQMQELAGRLRSPSRGEEAARHVSWGFKAPVSMVLVPFFEEAWGKAKFLHVVRDGRDIAFSGNQTPVEKFYADMFPEGSRELGLQEPSLKGIALWDRWNVGVYEWAASRKEKGAPGMDYLLLHAEDLIDPAAKFAAIKDVAEFVGSPLSDSELCCIATEGSKDMGSHTASRKDRGQITSRFGKWKGKVDGNPQLSKLLHHEGERGLRLFGYEPERSLRASSGFQCAAERDPTCPSGAAFPSGVGSPPRTKRAQPNVKVPAHVSIDDTDVCVGLKKEIDFQGFDVKAGHFEDHLGCCRECRKVLDCSFFTFDYNSGVCYLKSGKGAESPKLGLVSGMAQQAAMS